MAPQFPLASEKLQENDPRLVKLTALQNSRYATGTFLHDKSMRRGLWEKRITYLFG